jgi:crotonobetainyl-CoA:carnitine CoA-transferase CaiB-like acyl-CoA transferase
MANQNVRSGPLAGVTVLDLSRVLAGPWATQIFADLGAEVIKIERPGAGDDTRSWGPPFTARSDGSRGDAAYFFACNRGKRSVAIDIARPEGAALVRDLAGHADVLVENFKLGGLARYGLDFASLQKVNPRLVYCSITGFGQTGPYAPRAGYDYIAEGMGGLMSITGQPDGEPGAEPLRVGVAVADLFTGMYAATSVLAALLHARATGEGQHIDLALFDVQAAMLANQASNYFVSGKVPRRTGNRQPNLAPYEPFPAADRPVIIAVGNDGQFRALCRALGDPALADDPRFATNAHRVEHRAELAERIGALTRKRPAQHWVDALEAAGVACGPINTIDKVFEEPQARARELLVEQTREDIAAPVRTVASPIRMSRTPVAYPSPPPSLGADTEAVLSGMLGLTGEQIAELQRKEVL